MKRRKLKLDTLQESARIATMAALSSYPGYSKMPTENFTLRTFWEGDLVLFSLYIAADRPSDALVLTTAKVDSHTGDVVDVQIHDEAWARIAQPFNPADA